MAEEKPGEVRKGEGGKSSGVDAMDSKTERPQMIPVWFFVGILLLLYGVLIFIQGVAEWRNPPDTALSRSNPFHATLANLHPTLWWGVLLIVLGAIFTAAHYPRKKA
jgi:hypothetical protein